MTVKLYGTTGTAGSLTKDTTDLRYIFYPEPNITWDYKKTLDPWELPMEFNPIVMDSFTQVRRITLTGTIKQTTASEPTGASYLYERMEDLDKSFAFTGTWSEQPSSWSDEEVLCLEVLMPNSGNHKKDAFVVPEGLNFVFKNHILTYTATLINAQDLTIL